ncbi:MAG: hypothetical protein KDA91_23670, partial [Planctomycetaceae bacterium]|nr:hypothetical protein [Planctomycetaceae bacterium]
MAGVMLEKQTLQLRRSISRQYYQTDLLIEQQVALRLETQRLTAPAQLSTLRAAVIDRRNSRQNPLKSSQASTSGMRGPSLPGDNASNDRNSSHPNPGESGRLPLLRFQHPFSPRGID